MTPPLNSALLDLPPRRASTSKPSVALTREVVAGLLDRAARTVAPLFPLETFVAVNPYLGRVAEGFDGAAQSMSAVAGARLTLSREAYLDALATGRIQDRHLEQALSMRVERGDAEGLPSDLAGLRAALLRGQGHSPSPRVPTVADALGTAQERRWTEWVVERISTWASAHFDLGQASWRSPFQHLSPFAAWHAEACIDRTAETVGITGFRATVAALPSDPIHAATAALERLGVPRDGRALYLERLASDIGGWMAYARQLSWQRELREDADDAPIELLAIRLAWEVALLEAFGGEGDRVWATARETLRAPAALLDGGAELELDLVLHEAFELAWREDLLTRLHGPRADAEPPTDVRPDAQAVFCIDVRSEVYRRALEQVDGGVATLGFAGFFGFSLEYVPLGQESGGARCPALLTPAAVIQETVLGVDADEVAAAATRRNARRRASRAWKSFKEGAVSCFSFVGPVGLAYVAHLVSGALGIARPTPHPADDRLDAGLAGRLGPELASGDHAGRSTGMALAERIETAAGVLGAMSLTDGFARVVLLVGHGSTTVNNAHASGLDCGACGGHAGDANARVAAAVLNDPAVRDGLRERGIDIPDDTVFVAALHDTTTDDVSLYRDGLPASHEAEVERLAHSLAQASRLARRERAPRLGIDVESTPDVDAAVRRRSRDWSQVRPEWGLAGCAAFVVAPRERTVGRDLGGRAFLHSYRHQDDTDLGVLELILSAPMVVASWISLQYHGSTVDNLRFGSGDKTLHNVVSGLGVLEGNGGDLRTGLPLQSVHDGERPVHEPVRLHVVVEAPIEAIETVLERQPDVRRLLDGRWVHLFAMDDDGCVKHEYLGAGRWGTVSAAG